MTTLPAPHPYTVAIVGAGIAGLAVALRLARHGHHPTLIERVTDDRGRGHGFILLDDALGVLRRLGFSAGDLDSLGAGLSRYQQRLPHGEVIHLEALAGTAVGVLRHRLLDLLRRALPADVERRDANAVGLRRHPDGRIAAVCLDDGTEVRADLVVGADGASSRLREALLGPVALTPGGTVEVVGTISDGALARRLGHSFVKHVHPAGGLAMGFVPCGGDQVVWFIQRRVADGPPPPREPTALEAHARALVAGWSPELHDAFDCTDFTRVHVWVTADLDPLPSLHAHNGVLIGDAGHVFLPFTSQGVNFALNDACMLADALREHPLDEALERFSRARTGPIAATVASGRSLRDRFCEPAGKVTVPLVRVARAPFRDGDVPRDLLRARAFNLRWATLPPDVIPLTAADPDFPAAPEIREALHAYVRGGVFSYGPPEGLAEYREACAEVMRTRRGVPCEADRVLAVDSAAAGLRHLARLLLRPGDEAIVFDPVDFLFRASVESVGASVRLLPVDPATGRFDRDALARLISPRTRVLAVCNPHNPVGRVFDRHELLALGQFAVEHDLQIIDDGVWADIVFAPHAYVAMASLGEPIAARTWSVHGFSKTFSLAGLRVGYVVAPSPGDFLRLLEASGAATTMTGTSTLSQVAAAAAYTRAWPWAESFVVYLRWLRDLALRRLARFPRLTCRSPEGTYVLFPAIDAPIDAETLAARILNVARVAVVPGAARWFGPGARGHLRLAFCTSEGILNEALDRMERRWGEILEG
jgi:aspartate/methionine/tyrosine aminotransferase/2-polyprenyl-6-methoxyphenol hydroxylase-like FAD-dependent oxidoreductase